MRALRHVGLFLIVWASLMGVLSAGAQEEATPTVEKLVTLAPPREGEAPRMSLETIQQKCGPAVVKIMFTPISNLFEIKADPRQPEQFGERYGRGGSAHGSGFFIHPDGYLVTNAHVVEQANRKTLKCTTPATGNTTFDLELIGVGETDGIDLALLRLKAEELPRYKKLSGFAAAPFLRIADSNTVSKTEPVAILGYPEDSDDLRAKGANLCGRQYLGYWELIGGFQFLEVATASAVQSGNSGGAAVNAEGDLVGIPARGTWSDSTGWLIPSRVLLRFFDEVGRNKEGRAKMELMNLGLITEKTFPGKAALAGVPEEYIDHEVGISIFKVSRRSLGESWGLKSGDILVRFRNLDRDIAVYLDFEGRVKTTGAMRMIREGDRSWDNTDAPRRFLSELVMMSRPGDAIELQYVRKGTPGIQTVQAKLEYREVIPVPFLGTYEVPDYVEWGGMILQDLHSGNVGRYNYFDIEQLVQEGAVIVTHVDTGSLAEECSVSPQEVISTVNGVRVRNLKELRDVLRNLRDAYTAWTKVEGFREDKARYDARYYTAFDCHHWDNELHRLIRREVALPTEKAFASGASLNRKEDAKDGK